MPTCTLIYELIFICFARHKNTLNFSRTMLCFLCGNIRAFKYLNELQALKSLIVNIHCVHVTRTDTGHVTGNCATEKHVLSHLP